MQRTLEPGFDIGEFHVEPGSRLLVGPDGPHHVCEQLIAVLEELATHAGEVVDRRRIVEDVWHGEPGSDRALTRCVSRLRHYLHDDGHAPRYIETLPGEGYRLVAKVRLPEQSRDSAAPYLVAQFWTFLLELRQRKVCRAALVYAVVVWIVYQVADVVFPPLGAPEWVISTVVIFGLLGFPVALVLAWTFEVTPEGLKIERSMPHPSHDGSRVPPDLLLNAGLIGLALVISGQLLYASVSLLGATPHVSPDLNVRSLALAKFSRSDQAAGADLLERQLAAELRHRLRTEHGMKVVSLDTIDALQRTVPVEAEALLHGSLRVEGDAVYATVYVVDRATGFDVWSGILVEPTEPSATLPQRLAGNIADLFPTPDADSVVAGGASPVLNSALRRPVPELTLGN